MLEGIDLTQAYTTIGGVLGTPTAIVLFLMYSKVKENWLAFRCNPSMPTR